MENTTEQLKRARKVALVLATACMITIFIAVYALIQKEAADKRAAKVEELTKELELCKQK